MAAEEAANAEPVPTVRATGGDPGCSDPAPVWRMLDRFGARDAEMRGYWEPRPPVRVSCAGVHATSYVRRGHATLVAISSFSHGYEAPAAGEDRGFHNCDVRIEWGQLGLQPFSSIVSTVDLAAPGFVQPALRLAVSNQTRAADGLLSAHEYHQLRRRAFSRTRPLPFLPGGGYLLLIASRTFARAQHRIEVAARASPPKPALPLLRSLLGSAPSPPAAWRGLYGGYATTRIPWATRADLAAAQTVIAELSKKGGGQGRFISKCANPFEYAGNARPHDARSIQNELVDGETGARPAQLDFVGF